MRNFYKSFLAGVLISIGGIVNLVSESKYVGAFLFCCGLYYILNLNLNLYTGKIGFAKFKDIPQLFIILLGNFIGTFLIGNLISFTRLSKYIENAKSIVLIKLNDNILSIFILSIMCGILMFLAVKIYKQENVDKCFSILFGVMVFIISGYEHCIANMFYISFANMWDFKSIGYMIIMIVGNSIGSLLLNYMLTKNTCFE